LSNQIIFTLGETRVFERSTIYGKRIKLILLKNDFTTWCALSVLVFYLFFNQICV